MYIQSYIAYEGHKISEHRQVSKVKPIIIPMLPCMVSGIRVGPLGEIANKFKTDPIQIPMGKISFV